MNFNDVGVTEETLFQLYDSKGYNDTRKALEIALLKISDRIRKTNGIWTKEKLAKTKQLIQDEIARSYGGLFEQIQDESVSYGEMVGKAYLIDVVTDKLPNKVINEILNSQRNINGYPVKQLFGLTKDNHVRQLQVILSAGANQGLATNQIIKQLNLKNSNLTKSQLQTAVYSTLKDAREQARYGSFRELEKSGVVIGYVSIAVLDGRTSEICRDLDNKKWYLPIDDVPNKPARHFSCRSVLGVLTDNEYTQNKRSSMDGEIPNMSYGEWFSTKDAKYQRYVLGRKRYESYKNGSYKVNGVADIRGLKKPLNSIEDELSRSSLF